MPCPLATTENVAVVPSVTVWLAGWVVMVGPVVPTSSSSLPPPPQPTSDNASHSGNHISNRIHFIMLSSS